MAAETDCVFEVLGCTAHCRSGRAEIRSWGSDCGYISAFRRRWADLVELPHEVVGEIVMMSEEDAEGRDKTC